MAKILNGLKKIYSNLGGSSQDVKDVNRIPNMLNKIGELPVCKVFEFDIAYDGVNPPTANARGEFTQEDILKALEITNSVYFKGYINQTEECFIIPVNKITPDTGDHIHTTATGVFMFNDGPFLIRTEYTWTGDAYILMSPIS